MAAPTRHLERPCGCLVGEDGPVVLCRAADALNRHAEALLPPFYDEDPHSLEIYLRALRRYRAHVRTR